MSRSIGLVPTGHTQFSMAKASQAAAFFRISFSSRRTRFSRRSRRSSSFSSVVRPSVRVPSSRSAWRTQFQIDCAVGSNSRDSESGVRPPRTRSTICCRYSGEYGGRLLGIVSSSTSLRVSTKPGQLQFQHLLRRLALDPNPWIATRIPASRAPRSSRSTEAEAFLDAVRPSTSNSWAMLVVLLEVGPHTTISSGLPGATRCHVVPASAIYGRLMPRGAGFCHVFAALSSSDSRGTFTVFPDQASDVRRFRSAPDRARGSRAALVCSSSPTGASPVRVVAREPGSRLAARSGNGSGRSPASKAPLGGATMRSAASSEACHAVTARASG